MMTVMRTVGLAAVAMALGSCASTQPPQPNPKEMTFFVTSVGTGKGADLGGLDGADQHCAKLAKAVGAPDRTWRAYLSTQAPGLRDTELRQCARPYRHRSRGRTSWELRSRRASTTCIRRPAI